MSLLEPDELTRTDVIEYFIKALPLPLPLEHVPIDEELRVVADIMGLRKDGLSYHAVAAELNIRGIIGKLGGRFYASTIRAICINGLHSDIKAAA